MVLSLSPSELAFKAPFSKPFDAQVKFLKDKLQLPTLRYDDILGAAHDRAFIVAGAAKADLLNDFHTAIIKAAEEGKSLKWFKVEFENIVQRNGWSGFTGDGTAAGRDWRARIIYNTNLSTSYAAGRWEKMHDPDLLKVRPYWKYVHDDTVQHPRPLHLSWDGIVLHHSNPWWRTHFTPNGWGCRCRVVPVKASEYSGQTAPDDGTREVKDSQGNYHTVPNGIDYGWDYAPGANTKTTFTDLIANKLISVPALLGSEMMSVLKPIMQKEINTAFSSWVDSVVTAGVTRNQSELIGWINPNVLARLSLIDNKPATAEIFVEDRLIVGKKAARHDVAMDALSPDEWKSLPSALVENPDVYLDNDTGKIIYILPSINDKRSVKIVVEMDFLAKKEKAQLNLARSAFKVNANALLDRRRYTPLND